MLSLLQCCILVVVPNSSSLLPPHRSFPHCTFHSESLNLVISSHLTNGPTDQRTNGPTDQRTNGPTDGRKDKASYREAGMWREWKLMALTINGICRSMGYNQNPKAFLDKPTRRTGHADSRQIADILILFN